MSRILLLLSCAALLVTNMYATVKVEKTEYKGWHNCYRALAMAKWN
jgi:hypothetical protein